MKTTNLTPMQAESLDKYLEKSKGTLEGFMENVPDNLEIIEEPGIGWLEFVVMEDIFWIHTAYSKLSHPSNKVIWNKILDLARKRGCKKIRFQTNRNPKAFERLYNAYPVRYEMECDLEKGDKNEDIH